MKQKKLEIFYYTKMSKTKRKNWYFYETRVEKKKHKQ